MTEIDFSRYTTEQLIEALEGVNDLSYPRSAQTIYLLLLERLDGRINLAELGYRDELLDDVAASILVGGFKMLLLGDYWELSNQLEDKIIRIHESLVHNTTQV